MTFKPLETCCTCAHVLVPTPEYSEKLSETRLVIPQYRRVQCCQRVICQQCINNNQRFAEYCPFCQISSVPSTLPPRLKNPPSYTAVPSSSTRTEELSDTPPPYSESTGRGQGLRPDPKPNDPEKGDAAQDTLHFLNHEHDTITSLSFRYGVPTDALRRTNNIASDHLLQGRRTVLIPGEFYKGGVSLSPRPIEGEEEELRKNKIRRFMTLCKVPDYDVALLYLEQSSYDLDAATESYLDDERWEREHPKGKGASTAKSRPKRSAWHRP